MSVIYICILPHQMHLFLCKSCSCDVLLNVSVVGFLLSQMYLSIPFLKFKILGIFRATRQFTMPIHQYCIINYCYVFSFIFQLFTIRHHPAANNCFERKKGTWRELNKKSTVSLTDTKEFPFVLLYALVSPARFLNMYQADTAFSEIHIY